MNSLHGKRKKNLRFLSRRFTMIMAKKAQTWANFRCYLHFRKYRKDKVILGQFRSSFPLIQCCPGQNAFDSSSIKDKDTGGHRIIGRGSTILGFFRSILAIIVVYPLSTAHLQTNTCYKKESASKMLLGSNLLQNTKTASAAMEFKHLRMRTTMRKDISCFLRS